MMDAWQALEPQFREDLLKILLDKGLLALVVGGGLFVLNSSLERLKTRLSQDAEFEKERLRVAREVFGSLQIVDGALRDLRNAWSGQSGDPPPQERLEHLLVATTHAGQVVSVASLVLPPDLIDKLLLALSQVADVADGVHSWRDDVAANACVLRPQEMIWNALEDMRVQIVGKKRSATPLFGRRAAPKERWDPKGVVQDRARRLGRASAPGHGAATELLKALDVAEASIGLLVQKRLAIPLGTGDSEDAIGMALGGAIHHLRSAVVLIRLGRVQAGFVLLRAACECIDACFLFRSKPVQAANWLQGKMPVVEPAASRKERAKDHGGHERPQTRALADALYQVQSAYVHPSCAALLPNYYSVQGQEGVAFEVLNLVDHDQSRKVVVALLGSIFWAWYTLTEVFPGEMTIAAESQAAQAHYRATASKLGLPDPLSGV